MWKTFNYVRDIIKTMSEYSSGVTRAIAYLEQYKDRYSLEKLKRQLIQNGYPKDIIDKAVSEVFVGWGGFLDFKHRRTYTSFGSRLVDFFIGFLITVLAWLLLPFSLLIFIGLIAGVIYLWKRRYYVALGMLFAVIPAFVIRSFFGWYGIDYLWRIFF